MNLSLARSIIFALCVICLYQFWHSFVISMISILIVSTSVLRGILSSQQEKVSPSSHENLLFVYGTLKRGMHWHKKFLSHGATFLGRAKTKREFPLVVGSFTGVPYLLRDLEGYGHNIIGELYAVSDDTLEGLDQYEGKGKKGYYDRSVIEVSTSDGVLYKAMIYAVEQSPQSLRHLSRIPEYTLALHRSCYSAVRHISLKQKMYLQGYKQYSCIDLVHPNESIESDGVSL